MHTAAPHRMVRREQGNSLPFSSCTGCCWWRSPQWKQTSAGTQLLTMPESISGMLIGSPPEPASGRMKIAIVKLHVSAQRIVFIYPFNAHSMSRICNFCIPLSAPLSACRHDMYHTRLQFAVAKASRQCSVYSSPSASGQPLQSVLYTGPALHSILTPQYQGVDEHTLAVLEVPGLPEVCAESLMPAHSQQRHWQDQHILL